VFQRRRTVRPIIAMMAVVILMAVRRRCKLETLWVALSGAM
jgi:hypothetical protein